MTVIPFILAYYPSIDAARADIDKGKAWLATERKYYDHRDEHSVSRYRAASERLQAAWRIYMEVRRSGHGNKRRVL